MKVAIVGPFSHDIAFRVHVAGCADIARDERRSRRDHTSIIEVQSKREAVSHVYGPEAGSFYEEAGGDRVNGSLEAYLDQYIDTEVSFAPCTKGLKRS